MRVAHLACLAPPEIGGMGRVASEEVTHLQGVGVEARLFAPRPRETHQAPPMHVEQVKPYWRLRNAAMLPHGPILAWRPDVLHLHYPFYGTAETWLWRKPAIPMVVTFHMDATPRGWRQLAQKIQTSFLQEPLLRHADAILVSSKDYLAHSSAHALLQDMRVPVIELPFAVDTDRFVPASKIVGQPTQLLFVGGMDEAHFFKGIPQILEALSGLKEESWALSLVGDGSLRSRFEAQTKEYGLSDRVTFIGRLSEEDLIAQYQRADILLFPSTTGAEAFGLVAVEALACGTPVIASDLPGVRTVVRSEETGLLVPPRNVEALRKAMKQLMCNIPLREQLGQNAREQTLKRYSWPVHLAGLQEVYQRVCASRS